MPIDPLRLHVEKVRDDRDSQIIREIDDFLIEDFLDCLHLGLRVDESLLERCLETIEIGSSPDISEIEE